MIEKITKLHEALKEEFANSTKINTSEFRNYIKKCLEYGLEDCDIICDETNNPPTVIDECDLIARVIWVDGYNGTKYVDLVL